MIATGPGGPDSTGHAELTTDPHLIVAGGRGGIGGEFNPSNSNFRTGRSIAKQARRLLSPPSAVPAGQEPTKWGGRGKSEGELHEDHSKRRCARLHGRDIAARGGCVGAECGLKRRRRPVGARGRRDIKRTLCGDGEGSGRCQAPECRGVYCHVGAEGGLGTDRARSSIIGNDSRVKINNTRQYPYRAIALITFAAGRCTGWLIDSNTVATAGHCVAPGNGRGFYPRSSYRISAGANGAARPYGSCTAKELWSNPNWVNKGLDTFDYAAIVLNCNVGNTVGWFGFFSQAASLLNHPTIISGYPGDKPLTQWRSTDKVRVSQAQRLFYQNDTLGGQSGAPVWENRPNGPFGSAIHAYGTYSGPPFKSNNHGTRITKAVFDFLIRVRNR